MSSREPYLRIIRGDASPEETAALVAALAARAAAEARAGRPGRPAGGNWRNPAHGMRRTLPQGPGAWRRAYFPGT